jgi:hypothetical protein
MESVISLMSEITAAIQNVCTALTVGDYTYIQSSQPFPEKDDGTQSISNNEEGPQVKSPYTLHLGVT